LRQEQPLHRVHRSEPHYSSWCISKDCADEVIEVSSSVCCTHLGLQVGTELKSLRATPVSGDWDEADLTGALLTALADPTRTYAAQVFRGTKLNHCTPFRGSQFILKPPDARDFASTLVTHLPTRQCDCTQRSRETRPITYSFGNSCPGPRVFDEPRLDLRFW
jgi:hypothetical protein